MKLILLKEVDNLGAEGDVVTVKDGFGRNYLIPRGLAVIATAGAVRAQEEERKHAARRLTRQKDAALKVAGELQNTEVVLTAKVGEENRIFGTITSQQIAAALSAQGFDIDRRKIELDEDIRLIGVYTATVKLHPEVVSQVKVRVEPESSEG